MLLPLPTKQYKTGRVVVNWSAIGKGMTFQIDSLHEIEIVSNENVMKTSKSGKTRKERRLNLKLKGYIEVLNVGTESFKKLSFVKRLLKISKTLETKRFELSTYNSLPDFLEVSNKYNFLAYVLNFDELFTSESYEITDEEIEKVAKETNEEIEITIKTIKNYTSNHMDKRIEEVKNELDNAEYKIKLACNQTIEEFVLSIDDEKIKNLLNERTYRIYKNLFLNCISLKNLKQQYKKMAKKLHTDKGGNEKEFIGMKQAYEEVKELFEL